MNKNLGILLLFVVIILLGGAWFFMQSQSSQPAPSVDTNNTENTITATSVPSSSPTDSSPSGSVEEKVISITADSFSPKQLKIKAGETVTWMNNDSEDHQVNSAPHPSHTDYPPLNTIGLLKAGEKKSLMFPDKGTYKFHDHLNPSLFGSIVVE